jgi:hypothetical protein
MDDVPDLATLRRERVASDAEYIEQLEGLTIGLSHSCTELEDERDRLRATLDAERAQWVKETRHAARRIGEGARERDRLRAVVDAAMLLWYATYPTGPATASFIEARRAFEEAAAALDGSAEATDA